MPSPPRRRPSGPRVHWGRNRTQQQKEIQKMLGRRAKVRDHLREAEDRLLPPARRHWIAARLLDRHGDLLTADEQVALVLIREATTVKLPPPDDGPEPRQIERTEPPRRNQKDDARD